MDLDALQKKHRLVATHGSKLWAEQQKANKEAAASLRTSNVTAALDPLRHALAHQKCVRAFLRPCEFRPQLAPFVPSSVACLFGGCCRALPCSAA